MGTPTHERGLSPRGRSHAEAGGGYAKLGDVAYFDDVHAVVTIHDDDIGSTVVNQEKGLCTGVGWTKGS